MQRSSFGRGVELLRAEVAGENGQGLVRRGRARHDERIVVAWDGEIRSWIVAIRFVELVVVVSRLAEMVDRRRG